MDIGFEEEPGPESLIGQQLGPYRLERKVGEGGMGVVFEAVHQGTKQRVAVKVLHGRVARDGKTFHRFENEAKAIGAIKHPGLVTIHHYERLPSGLAYIAMEFLEGQALAGKLEELNSKEQRFSLHHALYLGRQIASVLTAAHERGIVHCDLKPDNVFLVRDPLLDFGERVKILDFGIAKFDADHGARKTTVGLVLGTPRYMSPEQCEGRDKISDKADVYALGVMLYELLAGKPPFEAETTAALLRQHMVRDPPSLTERAPGTPAAVVSLLNRMLAKDAPERPTMAEVSQSLERFSSLVAAPASGSKRRSLWPIAAAAGLLLLGGGAVLVLRSGGSAAGRVDGTKSPPVVPQKAPEIPKETKTVEGTSKPVMEPASPDKGQQVTAQTTPQPKADPVRARNRRRGVLAPAKEPPAQVVSEAPKVPPPVVDKPIVEVPAKPEKDPAAPVVEKRKVHVPFR